VTHLLLTLSPYADAIYVGLAWVSGLATGAALTSRSARWVR
jgi:hypothetical protein